MMMRPNQVARLLSNPRETAQDHVRNALQVLMDLLDLSPTLAAEDRRDVRAAVHRLWLALREMEREG
jgi:hypothetical protein